MNQWLTKCAACGGESLRATHAAERCTVAGIEFTAEVEALQCANCGETYVDDKVLERMELAIAAELGRLGRLKGEAFKYMRKSIGLRGVDLAELLDVTGETISRWERDVVPVDHAAFAVLGAMVTEKRQGRTQMRELLEATRIANDELRQPVKVKISAA